MLVIKLFLFLGSRLTISALFCDARIATMKMHFFVVSWLPANVC